MKKLIPQIIAILSICVLCCACDKNSEDQGVTVPVEAEVTHNNVNGMQIHENPNKKSDLNSDFGSDVIDKDDMQSIIKKIENGIQGVEQKEAYAKKNADMIYDQFHTIYNETQAMDKSNLEQMFIDADERMQSIWEEKNKE